MKKVMCVFGTRPEAIKMALVIKKLKAENSKFKTFVCVTAQHREMLDDVLNVFNIEADYDLDIMEENQTPFEVTAKGLLEVKVVLEKEKPDLVLVQGDTTTAFSVALASFYKKISVGHVEAGLRTYSKYNPFPEEINRELISKLSDFNFAPTEKAKLNLLSEGVKKESVFVTGNTVVDSLFFTLNNIEGLENELNFKFPFLNSDNKLILVTAHRRENFGQPLENICSAIKNISVSYSNVEVVYPVHPNPNVKLPVMDKLNDLERVYLIDPLNYLEFCYFMNKAYIILTDSGGVQEEAPSLDKPVLVMRNNTERTEAIERGVAKLVGTRKEKIVESVDMLLNNHEEYDKMTKQDNPFGDGKASERIIDILLEELK